MSSSRTTEKTLDKLPTEILLEIARCLDLRSYLSLLRTSKTVSNAASSSAVWEACCESTSDLPLCRLGVDAPKHLRAVCPFVLQLEGRGPSYPAKLRLLHRAYTGANLSSLGLST